MVAESVVLSCSSRPYQLYHGFYDALDRVKELEVAREARDSNRILRAGDISTFTLGVSQREAEARARSEIKKFGRDRIADGVYIAAGAAISRINITQRRLSHVLNRPIPGGAQSAGKSLFLAGEDVAALIRQGESIRAVRQSGGNYQRIVFAGRIIGVDRVSGEPTSVYTIITNAAGDLITAFPGTP